MKLIKLTFDEARVFFEAECEEICEKVNYITGVETLKFKKNFKVWYDDGYQVLLRESFKGEEFSKTDFATYRKFILEVTTKHLYVNSDGGSLCVKIIGNGRKPSHCSTSDLF